MIGESVGNFTIVKRLGQGGMGEVFLAEQSSIKTKVAIKTLLPHISSNKEHVQRFFNEAIAVSRIKHSGIAKIFDVGYLPSGHAYLIMEFLDGEALTSRIQRSGRLPIGRVADIGRQISNVLEATHQAGITHRDLKPDNIFLVPDAELDSGERVKILDFGIAKLGGTGLTGTNMGAMGTPGYMAPEQWHNAKNVDWRADAYSLGCVAFEMATGRVPFPAESIAEACTKHLTAPPPLICELIPTLPGEFEGLVQRLLEKEPAKRPQTMKEITQAFMAIGQRQPKPLDATFAAGATGSNQPGLAETVAPSSPPRESSSATQASTPATTRGGSAAAVEARPARVSRALAIGVGVLGTLLVGIVVTFIIFLLQRSTESPALRDTASAPVSPPAPPPLVPAAAAITISPPSRELQLSATESKPASPVPDYLDQDMSSAGINRVMSSARACGTKAPTVHGKVKVYVKVDGNGVVTDASVVETPNELLGQCVSAAFSRAIFPKTHQGGSFGYPVAF